MWAWGGGVDGRALVMTSEILYPVIRVECLILVEATLSQFPLARNSPTLASLDSGVYMSTWSLTGVDKTAGLAATSCSRRVRVALGVQSHSCAIVSAPG